MIFRAQEQSCAVKRYALYVECNHLATTFVPTKGQERVALDKKKGSCKDAEG
jgi:hypothetical protein